MKRPLLSLCIPTNGVSEWVIPVIDSIYSQNVDNSKFEVIVTNNGKNIEFEKQIKEYKFSNFHYESNDSAGFLNEIECYKLANGDFIKFVNHREFFLEGTLEKYIKIVQDNLKTKPAIFFTNGALEELDDYNEYTNFDEFVNGMSYLSSCSDGNAFWNSDFKEIIKNNAINELFPHTSILFNQSKKDKYIIVNTKMFGEIQNANPKKGKYDFFYAFAIEYPRILCNLLSQGRISLKTFKHVMEDNLTFILWSYIDFCIFKEPCSYILINFEEYMNVFYNKKYKCKIIWMSIYKLLLNCYRRIV